MMQKYKEKTQNQSNKWFIILPYSLRLQTIKIHFGR